MNKVKDSVKKLDLRVCQPIIKPTKSNGYKIPRFFWICMALSGVLCGVMLWASTANASVYDNIQNDIPGVCGIYTNSGDDYYTYFHFVSSTANITPNRFDFKACIAGGGSPATSTMRMDISSSLGEWYSETTVFLPACAVPQAFATTTFGYGAAVWHRLSGGSPVPVQSISDPYHVYITSIDVFTPFFGPGIAQSSPGPWDDEFEPTGTNYCEQNLPGGKSYGFIPQVLIDGTPIYQPTAPNPEDYFLTATTSAATQDFGFFGNLFRDVIIWLFQPNETIRQYFESEKNNLLQYKIPFAYFNDTLETFDDLNATGTQEMIVGATTTLGYFEFFDTENIKASPLMDILDYLKIFMSIAIWLGFLWYLYERLSDFNP